MSDDFPTLERPTNATWGRPSLGQPRSSTTDFTNSAETIRILIYGPGPLLYPAHAGAAHPAAAAPAHARHLRARGLHAGRHRLLRVRRESRGEELLQVSAPAARAGQPFSPRAHPPHHRENIPATIASILVHRHCITLLTKKLYVMFSLLLSFTKRK